MPAGRLGAELLERRVERNDFGVDRQLAQASRDELGVLRPEIENDDGLMRHGHVRRESLLYVVVAATRPTYCGVLVAAMVWLTAAVDLSARRRLPGRQRARSRRLRPFAVAVSARGAWADHAAGGAGATGGARRRSRWLVPLSSGSARRAELGQRRHGVVGAPSRDHRAGGRRRRRLRRRRRYAARARRRHRRRTLDESRRRDAAGAGARRARASSASAPASRTPSTPALGRELWARTLPAAGDPTGLAVSATALFAAYADGRVVALALADGREQWARPIDGRPSPPLLLGDALFVGTTEQQFYSLDAGTARSRWTWRTGGDVTGAAADAKAVYYTSLDAVVRAVNPGNGHQRWKRDARHAQRRCRRSRSTAACSSPACRRCSRRSRH